MKISMNYVLDGKDYQMEIKNARQDDDTVSIRLSSEDADEDKEYLFNRRELAIAVTTMEAEAHKDEKDI